jgi:hypothetical protein
MQLLGMPVNQAKVKELQTRLRDEISIIEAEIENLDVVKRYVKDTGGFNPLGEDAIALFRDYLKRSEIQVQDGQRLRWSIDKNVLEKIDHPLAELIVQLRNKTKMKSTYVDGLELNKGKYIYNNSILHCNFNTTFTTTGRLSSDEPNMQNFPSRSDAWVREQIQAPDGCTIIAIDYGQLEMCGAAMCSSDPVLKKGYALLTWAVILLILKWQSLTGHELKTNWFSLLFMGLLISLWLVISISMLTTWTH